MIKIKSILNKTLMPFIGKNGTIKPVRVFISIFLCLMVRAMWMKLDGSPLSDYFILGLIGQVSVLIAADTWRSNSKDKHRIVDYNQYTARQDNIHVSDTD